MPKKALKKCIKAYALLDTPECKLRCTLAIFKNGVLALLAAKAFELNRSKINHTIANDPELALVSVFPVV